MKDGMKRNPSVMAGLMAALGFSAALTIVPGMALADEVDVAGGPEDTQAAVATVVDDVHSTEQNASDEVVSDDSPSFSDEGSALLPSTADDGSETSAVEETDGEEELDGSDLTETVDAPDAVAEDGAEEVNEPDGSDDVSIIGELSSATSAQPTLASSENSEEEDTTSFTASWNRGEDGGWYWYDEGATESRRGWLVTDQAIDPSAPSGLQRYWLDPLTGSLAIGRLVEPGEGAGYWAYATDLGCVVLGKWVDPKTGYVYLADNDGRLEQSGWLVTDEYDGGMQRYWVDAVVRAAVPGVSSDGWDHFTTVAGYVARGKYWNSTDTLYLADNDGRLALGDASGWLVTSDFDGAFQRYWVNPETGAASTGSFVVADEHYYSLPELGYVLRGKLAYGAGMLLADNDGVLAWDEGWLVSDAYDGEMQRYRIDGAPGDGLMGAHLGFFTLEGNDYYSREDVGYTARNDWYFIVAKGSWYHADNDAVLTILVGKKVGYQNPARYPQVGAYTVTLPGYCTGYYTYVMPCQLRPDATRSDCVETFISAAMRYLGTTWVDNCCSRPGDTIDCTGLVLEGLYACGVSLDGLPSGDYNPYTKRYQNHHFANSWRLNQVFMPVSVGSIQRGDILYFEGHVAIYLGGGKILDSYPGTNTSVHSYYSSMYGGVLGAARLFV